MKTLSEVLGEDHRWIVRATECLERLADRTAETDELCIASAADLLEFFEHFADLAHQMKEECHLLPALRESRMAKYGILRLTADHRAERAMLASLHECLEGAAYDDLTSRETFCFVAREYARHQRQHAGEEDRYMIPLAEELLSDDRKRDILDGFERIEDALLVEPRHHYLDLVRRVARRVGLPEEVADAPEPVTALVAV